MSSLGHDPARFVAALLGTDTTPPPGLRDVAANGRFEIYRNSVVAGLVRALATRFPATERLVGGAFFSSMAQAFIRWHPPTSPLLMIYGETFPALLRGFAPAKDLPYLPDVAELEVARGRAYHAADAEAVPAGIFAAVPAEKIGDLRPALHPSVIVLRSAHPVVSIWSAQQQEAAPPAAGPWRAEDALVHRCGESVAVELLAPGEALFLTAMQNGACLTEAATTAMAEAPAFDASAALTRILRAQLTTELRAG
ncbi:MAG TPA: DNA-binding domain-containing protein [Falsiroseomonas sp.]|jgi:hypothetical protein|nr:DNA-binding domain-containing protein [Falsiroseomonas sp.]